uniref:Uncharacterized protein n=1 Tax=Oryza punctata TaxID=4537 RepID=A0A0E0KZL5_ORYPU
MAVAKTSQALSHQIKRPNSDSKLQKQVQAKRTVAEEMEVMKIKLKPFVAPVVRPTQLASSGFAVTFVRPGSMANVSESPLPRRSTALQVSWLQQQEDQRMSVQCFILM